MAIEKRQRKHNRQKIHKARVVCFTWTIYLNKQKNFDLKQLIASKNNFRSNDQNLIKIQNGSKYIFFYELELDSEHKFSLNFRENENFEQIQFLLGIKYLIRNLKGSVKIETEIEKWNDYGKIVELSNLCRELIS